jgi:hypothetical protein
VGFRGVRTKTSTTHLKGATRRDCAWVNQSEALPPGNSVQDDDGPGVVPHGKGQCVGAELTGPDAGLQLFVFLTRASRLVKGTKELAVGGVEQKPPTMCRRFPEQKPLAVWRPCQSLRIDSLR